MAVAYVGDTLTASRTPLCSVDATRTGAGYDQPVMAVWPPEPASHYSPYTLHALPARYYWGELLMSMGGVLDPRLVNHIRILLATMVAILGVATYFFNTPGSWFWFWAALGTAGLVSLIMLTQTPLNTRWHLATTVISAIFTALGGIGVAVAHANTNTETVTAEEEPVRITDIGAQWLGTDGRYALRGHVDNLGPGQFIWTYNQPFAFEDNAPLNVWPDPGPCPVDENGNFYCKLGYAGSEECDGGRKYALWAAVVTDEDAYDAATIKSGLEGRNPYANPLSVPHVDGEDTMVSSIESHPGTRIPESKDCS